ncbi:MAG: translocation/assembly module TamB domain-containing protein [Sphingobacteriaceae bacterium]
MSFLEKKIKTNVSVGHITLGLPKLIVLEDVYFEDQQKDTLLAGEQLKVDISLMKLLDNKVEINEINLKGITAKISRTMPDSTFNFDYIIKAFTGEQKKEVKPEDTTSTMKFSIEKVILDKIRLSFKDAVGGNDVVFYLGHFDTQIKDFDMDNMKFKIPKITASGIDAKIVQVNVPPAQAKMDSTVVNSAKSKPLDLDIGTLDLSKIKVDFQSQPSSTNAKVDLGTLLLELEKIDLQKQQVIIKNLELKDTKAALVLLKSVQKKSAQKAKESVATVNTAATGWNVKLKKVDFANNDIQFDNNNAKPVDKGIDYMHMNIKNLLVQAENILYSPEEISGKINDVKFTEKSGLNIQEFHTNFLYGEKQAYLNDLYLKTPQTLIKDKIHVGYRSIASLTDELSELRVDANLNKSRLGFKDILIFVPTMAQTDPLKSHPNTVLVIDGKVSGKVSDLYIPSLEISGIGKTRLKASARLKGLPDMNKAWFDVKLDELTTGSSDIAELVSKGTLPSSIRIPEFLSLNGIFKGSMANFNTNLRLRSSYGNVSAIATMAGKKGAEIYRAKINMVNFNVGRLIKQDSTLGRISMNATVDGRGLDIKTANAKFDGLIQQAQIKGYNYRNLKLKGDASKGDINAFASIADENIALDLKAKANMSKKYPDVNMVLNVDSINLQKLNFTKEDIRFHGKLSANVPTADPDYLNGNIQLTELAIARATGVIRLDTVSVISTATADSNTLKLRSEILRLDMSGKYKLTEVATALQATINKYYNVDPDPSAKALKYSPQRFTFKATLIKASIFDQFVPELKKLDPVNLSGGFNSETGDLKINGTVPNVIYGANTVNNMQLAINTGSAALNYKFTFNKIEAGGIQLLNTSLSGKAQNNVLDADLSIKDRNQKEQFRIAGALKAIQKDFNFKLFADRLVLNYDRWMISDNNSVQFGPKGILASNFSISNNNQVLSINSNPQTVNSPLSVNFKNFKIETITKIAQQDSLLAGGTINGNVLLKDLDKTPVFTADLQVDNFSFRADTVGNIALKVNNETPNAFNANVNITGKGNDVKLSGMYYTQPKGNFDLNLDVKTLNLKSIEGFTFGSLKQTSGVITGQLKITGTTTAPKVLGDLSFRKAGFNVAMFNSYYRLEDEKIVFNQEGIRFNNFTLVDSAGNKAVIRGNVYTRTFSDFRFGMTITSDNFRVLNSTAKDNDLYYGKLFLDSRIRITGDMNKPVVDATLKINDKTNLTFVLPQNSPGKEEREGIVEFVDKDSPFKADLLTSRIDSLAKSSVTGLDASANIEIDKNAEFNVIIDAGTGDFLKIRGESQLVAGIDPSGKISLTGNYTVEEGGYNLSFNFIKRKFDIKKGSTITWTGELTSANVDLTAIYVADTAPLDLVEKQVGGNSAAAKNIYKQKLPFQVLLIMKGELMKPEITFDIVLPEGNYNVSSEVTGTVNARLAQLKNEPSELNKQVFALLLLNRFIAENPFESAAGGGGAESIARQSASKLLSDQLNKLAGGLINGVDLNFDLNSGEDYTTGQLKNRTDLNVGLSKRLLNDRLKVNIGSNFELEGPSNGGRKTTNIAGDISVDYQLSKDGKYILRAYRKDQYVVVQGQVIETGIGFIMNVDYNQFKELFAKKPQDIKERDRKERDRRRQERKSEGQQIQNTESN